MNTEQGVGFGRKKYVKDFDVEKKDGLLDDEEGSVKLILKHNFEKRDAE